MSAHMPRRLALMTTLPLIVAACTGGGLGANSPGASPSAAASASGAAMMMQPGAEKMKVTIISPKAGATITGNTLDVKVQTEGFTDSCDFAGKPIKEGQGHYHIALDKSLVNMFCTDEATVSMQNVKAGQHTITVVPAQDDHAEVDNNAQSVTFTYQPSNPLPELKDDNSLGAPSIKILSPKAGASVSGSFDVVVEVKNFHLSCDLMGKPDLKGYGHWHLNLDSTSEGMGGMGTMAGMSCAKTFHATTAGLKPGSKHTLIAILEDNGHSPFKPEIADKVDVTVQ
jgi:hypothetical protein